VIRASRAEAVRKKRKHPRNGKNRKGYIAAEELILDLDDDAADTLMGDRDGKVVARSIG
jgi:hypothetical protein